jgi:hypothetical protein
MPTGNDGYGQWQCFDRVAVYLLTLDVSTGMLTVAYDPRQHPRDRILQLVQ